MAKATLNLCGQPDTVGVTYRWSNGETTRTASALCAGVDTVTISIACEWVYKDTVTIPLVSGGYTIVRDSVNQTCATQGSASVALTGGKPPYSYDWSNGSTTSSTGPVSAGVYCVGMRDNSGCFDSICITVIGTPFPTVTISPSPDTICPGTSTTLTSTATGGTAPYSYSWNTTATTSSITVTPAATTSYTVTATDVNGCNNSATVNVVVLPTPVTTITAPGDSICLGATMTLTASAATTYLWAPATGITGSTTSSTATASPTVTTTYTLTETDSHGCSNTATFTIHVGEPATIIVSPNDTICPNTTVTLNATVTGSSGRYLWLPGGSTAQSITVMPTTTTTYTVTYTNNCNTVSANVTVTVFPLPVPLFSTDVAQGCAPLCIQFRNLSTVSAGKLVQWQWAFGNGDTSDIQTPVYCYPKPGDYDVTLTTVSNYGCSSTLKILDYIKVYSSPNANFSVSPQPTTIMSPTIQFTDKSTDTYGIVYWNWNFGDNKDSLLGVSENPSHTYSDTGTFCVKLGVENIHGCTDTMTDCLIISPLFTLYIPSAFTPADVNGLNTIFMAKGNDIKSFEMYIFDRWGMQLFHSTDINNGWNGTVKGGNSVCQEDTYVYIIKATDSKNVDHSYTGTVTLLK